MVVDLLERVDAEAGALALVGDGRSLTFGDLKGVVDEEADRLRSTGVEPGTVAPVTVDAAVAGVISLLAHWRVGATPAPMNARLTEAERATAAQVLAGAPSGAQAVLWTSGTAGRPRGVAISFEALRASAEASAHRLSLGPGDAWLVSLSPAHVGGLALVTRALLLGSRLVAAGPFDAARAAELLPDVTHLSLVPTQLGRLLDATDHAPPPATFRCALVGGAHAPTRLVERGLAAGWPLALTYGLSEATSQVATAPPELTRRKPGTVGKPLTGVDLRVDESGEILVRGATLATGYVGGAEELTDEEGWHRTGDLGRLDADGHLWVSGRRSDRIVTGGVNVDAVEVEEALRAHPAVADAGVVGVPDAEWGERVVAWIVPAAAAPDPRELDAFLRERLSGPKLPRGYRVASDLPLNPNGKVNRAAVRDALAAEEG